MKWIAVLSVLSATPVLLTASAAPVVTALAELWTGVVVGVVFMALGLRAWFTAPLQVAAFETADPRHSPWPPLLVFTAAIAGLLSALIGLFQAMAPGHLRAPSNFTAVLLCGAVALVTLLAQQRMPNTTLGAETDVPDDKTYRRGALMVLFTWGVCSLLDHPVDHPNVLGAAALALVVWRGWDRPWQRAARWQAVLMVVAGAAALMHSLHR